MHSIALLICSKIDSWEWKYMAHVDTMEAILQKWNK